VFKPLPQRASCVLAWRQPCCQTLLHKIQLSSCLITQILMNHFREAVGGGQIARRTRRDRATDLLAKGKVRGRVRKHSRKHRHTPARSPNFLLELTTRAATDAHPRIRTAPQRAKWARKAHNVNGTVRSCSGDYSPACSTGGLKGRIQLISIAKTALSGSEWCNSSRRERGERQYNDAREERRDDE
jgi:hypothetical protein